MKTHDLADALKILAAILKKSPNVEISEVGIFDNTFSQNNLKSTKNINSREELPIALNALMSIKDFSKKDWQLFIDEFNIDIEITPRDSSRNILGRVLNYLEKHPEIRQKIRNKSENRDVSASKPLLDALSSLLKTN